MSGRRCAPRWRACIGAAQIGVLALALVAAPEQANPQANPQTAAPPERVTFPSADGRTTLVGYLYKPRDIGNSRVPAVVMMHGRAGAYSSLADGRYDADTLSQRHQMWGRLWADQGYVALLVDGFGPRGYPRGFPRFSYKDRPKELDEVTMRPLDAYGALAYLRARSDVAPDRIGLQGWSNGGSAALATMAPGAPGRAANMPGFRAALVFYPACRLKDRFDRGFAPYAPVRVFHGSADEEVSPARCRRLVDRSRARGGDIDFTLYPGAAHGFDDPGGKRQGVAANASATADATARAERFFAEQLRPR
jgi:dienelactone hydrolase